MEVRDTSCAAKLNKEAADLRGLRFRREPTLSAKLRKKQEREERDDLHATNKSRNGPTQQSRSRGGGTLKFGRPGTVKGSKRPAKKTFCERIMR